MVLVAISAVLGFVNLLLWAWLHEKGRSGSIAPVMTALGLSVLSLYMFVLTEARQDPRWLWLGVQVVLLLATAGVVRWDRLTDVYANG